MTKTDLIDEVAATADRTKKEIEQIVDAVLKPSPVVSNGVKDSISVASAVSSGLVKRRSGNRVALLLQVSGRVTSILGPQTSDVSEVKRADRGPVQDHCWIGQCPGPRVYITGYLLSEARQCLTDDLKVALTRR
jgi:hypothetical protein